MINSNGTKVSGLDNFPLLSNKELHVWQVSTNITPEAILKYKNVLTEKEVSNISFFKFKQAKDSYVVSQGVLRMLLSEYLGISPKLVKIGRKVKGKPYSIDDPNLNFNVSNSGQLVAIAFSYNDEVGIDIEQIRPLPDLDEMINTNFSAKELNFINSKPKERLNRFFRLWTVKESYLKAIGEGMRLTPDSLEFSIDDDRIKLLSIKGVFEQEDWKFKEFSASTDCVGTIAYSQDNTVIKFMDFK
jgi:4'-phosphopantetheinyl transferase